MSDMGEIIKSVVVEYHSPKEAVKGMKKGEIASCPMPTEAYAIYERRALLYRDHEGRFWGTNIYNIDPEKFD